MIFAEASQGVLSNEGIQFLVGLVSVLGVVTLVLGVCIQCKKLFGKTPPLDDQIKTLRDEFKKSVAGVYRKVEEERHEREQAFADLALERGRTLQTIRDDFEAIRTGQAVMNVNLQFIKDRIAKL